MPHFQAGTGIPSPPSDALREREAVTSKIPSVTVRNRRRKYLQTHPEYLENPELELADSTYPLLWDRLVRRFQSVIEREAEGKRKGFSGILEADILRGEAKRDALQDPDSESLFTYRRGADGEILAEERDEVPQDKADGLRRWTTAMETRFVRGADADFDYRDVDENDEYDDRVVEEQDAAEKYFDEEDPDFIAEDAVEGRSALQGETGLQDF